MSTAPSLNLAAAWKDLSEGRFSDCDRWFFYSGAVAMNALLGKLNDLHGDNEEALAVLRNAVRIELEDFLEEMRVLAEGDA